MNYEGVYRPSVFACSCVCLCARCDAQLVRDILVVNLWKAKTNQSSLERFLVSDFTKHFIMTVTEEDRRIYSAKLLKNRNVNNVQTPASPILILAAWICSIRKPAAQHCFCQVDNVSFKKYSLVAHTVANPLNMKNYSFNLFTQSLPLKSVSKVTYFTVFVHKNVTKE